MAYDKIVDSVQLDANLTSIANAIREKNGTSEQISFPDGFVTAINALETGGAITVNATNLHDTATDIADTYLNSGVEEVYKTWKTTDYIPIASNTVYAFHNASGYWMQGAYCAKYSADKKFIAYINGGLSTFADALMLWKSDSDGYIRFSAYAIAIEKLNVYACKGTINGMPSG